MELTAGSRLGPYEIVARIGAGGMGEVFRARDTRLERDVAIKVLSRELADNAELRIRLDREARVISRLNDPHICTLHDVGQENGVTYLVMELLEGDTLNARIDRSRLPLDQVARYGAQIARALGNAHRLGIVHRDLKPSNVVLTRNGAKILDFGIAKILAPSEESESEALTLTARGQLIGTPRYMAPEQLLGKQLDHRTDIFALGIMLYEMATGTPAFDGSSRAVISARILEHDPPELEKLDHDLGRIIRRCLNKEPEERWQNAEDVAFQLIALREPPPAAHPHAQRLRSRVRLPVVVGMLGLIAGLVAMSVFMWPSWRRPAAATEAVRLTALLPRGVSVTEGPGYLSSVALSPDGRVLVVAGTSDDGLRLYQRPINRLEATPLAGTAGGMSPFFSPDGQWIGFFAEGRLRRIPLGGGPAVDVTSVPEDAPLMGATWGPNDQIVLVWGVGSALHSVNMRGGSPEPITKLEGGEEGHYRPEFLPDGRVLLFDDGRWIHALDRVSGRRVRLVQGVAPRYAAGRLLFCRRTTLLAARFDPARLEITGAVDPLVEGVGGSEHTKHYAVSRRGTLAYVPAADTHSLALVNADGTERGIEEAPSFENPRFSPDGALLAVATLRQRGENTDIWIHDLKSGAASRLTFDGGRAPVWTPDGASVTYSHLGDAQGIYRKSVDGRGDAKRLLALDEFHWLVGWTPDSRALIYGKIETPRKGPTSRSSIVELAGGRSRDVVEPGPVWGGRLSPDGRWLAYYRLETAGFEVYVTPFPEGGRRWLISEGGGRDPNWGPDGKELYYRSGQRLVAARIDTGAGVRVLSRRLVLEPFRPPLYDDYDIHPDGRTLVLVRPAADLTGQVMLVVNELDEVERRDD